MNANNTLETVVAEQISSLYGLGILRHRKYHADDPNEEGIRKILNKCTSESQMISALYNVKRGNEGIEEMIIRKTRELKTVIYKSQGIYYTTTMQNWDAGIQDARAIHKMQEFKSPQEIIDYYCEHFGSEPEDFIIMGGGN
jgi:hypothetical protein